MATRRTRKRPLEHRFDWDPRGPSTPRECLTPMEGKECADGDSAFCCQLRAERRSLIPRPLYFIFGRNGKHLAHRRRPSILHHSFPLSSSSNRGGPRRLLHSRRLVFYLFFSLSLALSSLRLPSALPSTRCPNRLAPFRLPTVPPPIEGIDRSAVLLLPSLFSPVFNVRFNMTVRSDPSWALA